MITTFNMPLKIIFGEGSVNQLGEEAKAVGKKAMVVTYPDIRKVGLLDRIVKNLMDNGIETSTFEEVEPNPRSTTIDKGAVIARENKIDLVIGVGGGSAMDSAKGIAVASTGTASVWDYVMRKAQAKEDILSLIQIPTLAGTGSELNNIGVISNWETHEKRILFHPKAWAKVSIIDPELTVTVPKFQTGSGAADTFAHIVEYYIMPEKRLPVNDAWREALMRIIVEFLPRALDKPDDIEARTQLSWTSTIAMSQLARIGGTVGLMTCHSIEHALSAIYDVAHGAGLAALLPAWMKRLQPVRQERFDMLGKNVFGKKDGIKAFEEWLEEVGIRIRLGDLGCEIERADDIAENVLLTSPGGIDQYPGNLDAEAIAQIYRDSF